MAVKPPTVVSVPSTLQSSVQIGTLCMISLGVLMMAVDLGRKDETLRQIQIDTSQLKTICSDLVKSQVRAVANDENMIKELAMLASRLDKITK
jgi:uncharacterized membrane protein